MARLIPSSLSEKCVSPGEKEIFTRFKSELEADEWIILHSLDIAQHIKQVSGEADFVIIVPNMGVLCLEVKACHSLERKDGLWFYGLESKGDPRGPFKQSSDAMHSLRNQVVQQNPSLSRVPFWSAVVFPYIEFNCNSVEWHSWQVVDSKRFKQQHLASIIRGILRNARSHLKSQETTTWFHEDDRLPTVQQAADLAKILRPNFEFSEKAPDRRARKQSEILRYSEEQFVAIDMMEVNPRVLFTGPAGTGKTILAIETARRYASMGKRVLLLCYNQLLGSWYSNHPVIRECDIKSTTLHQYMSGIANIRTPHGADQTYWENDLPDSAVSKLLNGHEEAGKYDLVVLDEVQDLLHPPYLDIIELVLIGGLRNGYWRMFGDFERQMLYGQDREQAETLIRQKCGNFATGSLRVNCRNTPRIATLSTLLGRLTPNYTRILRPDDHIEPTIIYYSTPSQQRRELISALVRLQKDSYTPEEIVVLSSKGPSHCVASKIDDEIWSSKLAQYNIAKSDQIRYSSIYRFKGLDSPAIVVTDIEKIESDKFSSLFYVATTRALERLIILVHETAKPGIIKSLTKPN